MPSITSAYSVFILRVDMIQTIEILFNANKNITQKRYGAA